jgi:hypothetical protein
LKELDTKRSVLVQVLRSVCVSLRVCVCRRRDERSVEGVEGVERVDSGLEGNRE